MISDQLTLVHLLRLPNDLRLYAMQPCRFRKRTAFVPKTIQHPLVSESQMAQMLRDLMSEWRRLLGAKGQVRRFR